MTENNSTDKPDTAQYSTTKEIPDRGELSRSTRVWVLTLLLGVILPGGVLSYGWWGYYYGLGPAKADPMASKELLGLELIDEQEKERWDAVISLEGPTGPSLTHQFALNGRDPDQVLNELGQYAQKVGWEHEPVSEHPNQWVGHRKKILYEMRLDIWCEGDYAEVSMST
jgi:hypothetical protein